jgi:hypothetical protein
LTHTDYVETYPLETTRFLSGPNIEFSCAAESLGPDGSMEQSSAFRTEAKASAATTC